MNIDLKKMIFINTILTFLLAFLIHFIYEWLPYNIIAIFCPVNESIWEHMKMLFTTIVTYLPIEYLLMKKFNIEGNNLYLNTFIKGFTSIPIYLILFMPLNYLFGENMFIAISIMLLTILIVNIISYKLLNYRKIKYQVIIAISLILLTYIVMGILTFNPPKNDLFLDTQKNIYGINIKK